MGPMARVSLLTLVVGIAPCVAGASAGQPCVAGASAGHRYCLHSEIKRSATGVYAITLSTRQEML
jgi:hypothetical protein